MRQSNNNPRAHIQRLLFLAFLWCYLPPAASAAETAPITVFCLPNALVKEMDSLPTFPIEQGKPIRFTCSVRNMDQQQTFSAMLLGTETSSQNAPVVSSTTISIPKNTSTETTLEFPMIFQNGTYQFSFTLFDTATKKSLATTTPTVGLMGGTKHARIISATTDKERYTWESPFTLTLTTENPSGLSYESSEVLAQVILLNNRGDSCGAPLVDSRPIKESQTVFSLQFPQEGSCSNSIAILLSNKRGVLLDKKIIAVGLDVAKNTPKENPAAKNKNITASIVASIPRPILIGGILTGALLIALTGYFVIRRKRHS